MREGDGLTPAKGTMEWALDAPFKAKAPARTQKCTCGAKPKPHRATTYHHWLPQKTLRQHARSWAREVNASPENVRAYLYGLLRDERNLTPMCHQTNLDLENWSTKRPTPPKSAYEFAAELGEEWLVRLERSYGEPPT